MTENIKTFCNELSINDLKSLLKQLIPLFIKDFETKQGLLILCGSQTQYSINQLEHNRSYEILYRWTYLPLIFKFLGYFIAANGAILKVNSYVKFEETILEYSQLAMIDFRLVSKESIDIFRSTNKPKNIHKLTDKLFHNENDSFSLTIDGDSDTVEKNNIMVCSSIGNTCNEKIKECINEMLNKK